MAILRLLQILVVVSLLWIVPNPPAIAHPLHELESPDLFFARDGHLTPQLFLAGLGIAFGFGAVHALAPGHGKTMVAAYLVGNRGTAKHAIWLGIITTISHTISVLGLAVIALMASRYLVPEQLYPVLSTLSGLTVLGVGVWLLRQSWQSSSTFNAQSLKLDSHVHCHPHSHEHQQQDHTHSDSSEVIHDHQHHPEHHLSHLHQSLAPSTSGSCNCHHSHSHNHDIPDQLSWKSLLALGIAGGMVPCPSALVLLLSAIAFHQAAYGLALVMGFSLGLAAVLIALGLTVVYAKRWFEQLPNQASWLRYLPLASASVIILTGVVLTGYAVLPRVAYAGS